MSTCIHQQLCCTCVCDLWVSPRVRDEEGGVTVVRRVLADLGDSRVPQIRFEGLSIVGLPWHRGLRWMRRRFLCLSPGRSREGRKSVLGTQTAGCITEAAVDSGISTVVDER